MTARRLKQDLLRRATLFLLLWPPLVAFAEATTPSAELCRKLDRRVRAELIERLELAFLPTSVPICRLGPADLTPAAQRYQGEVTACLLVIYRHGLQGTGLWHHSGARPNARDWALSLIDTLDRVLAVRLRDERNHRSTDKWERLEWARQRLALGDVTAAPLLVTILHEIEPASLPQTTEESPDESRVMSALAALVRADERDAVPLLDEIEAVAGNRQPAVPVWLAQLRRELPRLESFARRPGSIGGEAIESLARIGAWEILRRLAADETVPGRETARWRLEEKLPKQLGAIDPSSPCQQLGQQAHRELVEWLRVPFPLATTHGVIKCGTHQRPLGLLAQASVSSACLTDLYRHGLVGSGLWDRAEPEPYGGTWALDILGMVDREAAIRLWIEWRDAPGRTQLQRIAADVSRARLGDRGSIVPLTAFLQSASEVPQGPSGAIDELVREAADELIRLDHQPARHLLELWRARGVLRGIGVDIGIAQLGRDAAKLEQLARSTQSTSPLTSLRIIGATEVLERLAADPTYPYRTIAEYELRATRPAPKPQ